MNVVTDYSLSDIGSLLEIHYLQFSVDRETAFYRCLSMRQEKKHSHDFPQTIELLVAVHIFIRQRVNSGVRYFEKLVFWHGFCNNFINVLTILANYDIAFVFTDAFRFY